MKTSVFALSLLRPSFAEAYQFQVPVQLKGGDQPIKTQSPGCADPCLHDLDGDGKLDLIVGDRVSLKSPLGGASWEEAKEQIEALAREFHELRDKLSKIPPKEARQERNKKGLSTMTSAGNL